MEKVKEYSDKDAFARHCGVDVLDIGVGCGTLIGTAAFIWKGQSLQSLSIMLSAVLSILTACNGRVVE